MPCVLPCVIACFVLPAGFSFGPFWKVSKSLDFDGGLPPVPAELNYKRTMYIISLYLKECNKFIRPSLLALRALGILKHNAKKMGS